MKERLSEKYSVDSIDGTMSIEARGEALRHFRDPNGAEIMVCTDAAGEGIDMQLSNIEINYDIPWNPTRLEQRIMPAKATLYKTEDWPNIVVDARIMHENRVIPAATLNSRITRGSLHRKDQKDQKVF